MFGSAATALVQHVDEAKKKEKKRKKRRSEPMCSSDINSRGSRNFGEGGPRNMKYKPPHLAAIFFWPIFTRHGLLAPTPLLDPLLHKTPNDARKYFTFPSARKDVTIATRRKTSSLVDILKNKKTRTFWRYHCASDPAQKSRI